MSDAGVPFLDLKRQYAGLRAEIESAVSEVLRSQRFILGPEGGRLEAEIAALCGVRHAAGVASGTDALVLALQAAGLGPGDEVVTSPFSFLASASSIVRLGARPAFADVDADTLDLDPEDLGRRAGRRTRALVPVHIFGQCAPVEALIAAAEAACGRRPTVVEDAAQALGALRHGRPAGSLGDAGCLSFYPTKNLGGAGDAGMVVTDDDELARRVRLLRAHGDAGRYDHREVGLNSRLDEIQAAVLRVKARRLREWNEQRRRRSALYDRLLASRPGGLRLPAVREGNVHTWHQYVVRSPRRDDLARHLASRGIGTAVYYPTPLHLQACFRDLGHAPGAFPRAEAACREVLALPLYPELTEPEQERVAEAVHAFFRGG